MKKALLILSIIIMILSSCESLNDNNILKDYNIDDYLFRTGSGIEYKYSDFELYDSSTHILYFKTSHPEIVTEKSQTFSLLANGKEIYKGSFWPSYSSSLPSGPFISSVFSFYPDYTIRIEFINIDNKPDDPRNDPRIISALKEHNLLHSGLSVSINSLNINRTQLTFKFTVTNHDRDDLLILDLDKTGPNLFHYFTNGLSIRKLTYEEVFKSNIQVYAPTPWNDWRPEWLSEIKSGDSRQFTINYTIGASISPGEYLAMFQFPGFARQVTKDQFYQINTRIWLGDINLTKRITVK